MHGKKKTLKSQRSFDILVLEIIFSAVVYPHLLLNVISGIVAVTGLSLLTFLRHRVIYKDIRSTVDTLYKKLFVHNGGIKFIICNRVTLELESLYCAVKILLSVFFFSAPPLVALFLSNTPHTLHTTKFWNHSVSHNKDKSFNYWFQWYLINFKPCEKKRVRGAR